jgi:5'-deoxynucleotidase YfbR-like HD superfamily hydrolase
VFYSVAEHSVRCSQIVPESCALWALLHDASEAYIGDMSTQTKNLPELEGYRKLETSIMRAVAEKFGLPWHGVEAGYPPIVKWADAVLLATEARDLMSPMLEGWGLREPPLRSVIVPWDHKTAERQFLQTFYLLYEAR